MKTRIHCHQRNTYEMKAEFLTFQSTNDSLHTIIHEPRNINFKRRRKFDGTSVFSAIQTSVKRVNFDVDKWVFENSCLWKINVCAHLYGPQYENYGFRRILKYDMVLFMKFEQRIESITLAKSSIIAKYLQFV